MRNIGNKLQAVANVAIVIVMVLIGIVVYEQHQIRVANRPRLQIAIGAVVPIGEVDWRASTQTLIFALSTSCHFCTESAPFYRELLKVVEKGKTVHSLALFPQNLSQARQYLNSLNLQISDVRQISLDSIPLSGTPTLLLADNQGRLQHIWQGKLSPEDESTVFAGLGRFPAFK